MALKGGSESKHRFADLRVDHPSVRQTPIQLKPTNAVKRAAYKARDLHHAARDKLDRFKQLRAVRQGRAVLGFLGLAGGTHGDEARYAFKSQAKLAHSWNKFWGGGPGAGPEGGASPDETALGGTAGKGSGSCCPGGKGGFPEDRFARSAEGPKAKSSPTPAAENRPETDQTSEAQPDPPKKAKTRTAVTKSPALEHHRQRLAAGQEKRKALRQRLDTAKQERRLRRDRKKRFNQAKKNVALRMKGIDPEDFQAQTKARVRNRLAASKGTQEQRIAARQARSQQALSSLASPSAHSGSSPS